MDCKSTTANRLFVALAVMALIFAFTGAVFAQRLDGTLRGEVRDTQGAVVPDAKVTATGEKTNATQTTTTSSVGSFTFPNLLVGPYTVTVEKTGFAKSVNRGVEVRANQVVDVTPVLQIGTESTTVEVTAGTEAVQTSSSQLTFSIPARAAAELPISSMANGSVIDLSLLAPNVTSQPGGMVGDGGSVAGVRPRGNSFSIDGVDDNDSVNTGHLTTIIGESVAEFNIITSQYSAEYGAAGGGMFNTITKTGTNSWHGEGYIFNNNRDLNAMDNIEKGNGLTSPSRIDVNRFGGNLGGPIIKNKVFIFGAYERNQAGFAPSPTSFTTVTQSGLAQLKAMNPNPTVSALLDLFPISGTQTGVETVNGQAIAIGQASVISPIYSAQHDYIINGDIQLTKHRISMRYLYDRFRAPNTNPIQPQPIFNGAQFNDGKKAIVTDAWSINARVVNDFRVSYARDGKGFGVSTPPVPGLDIFPNIEIDTLGSNLGPEGNSPQGGSQNIYDVVESISVAKGRHSIKVGIEGKHWINPSLFLPRLRGEYDYTTLEQFFNDNIPTGGNGALRGAGSAVWAGNQSGVFPYFQDDFKVTPRLTLNLGIRYEYLTNPRDENTQALNGLADCSECLNMPGMGKGQPIGNGITFRAPRTDTNNWAPRFGFAYDPFGTGRWSIRGGAGVSYSFGTFQNLGLLQLPPEFQAEINPVIACTLSSGRPAWATPAACADITNITTNSFLAGGGLPGVLVPPTNRIDARNLTGSFVVDQVQPKVFSWSLGVQHEITGGNMIELRYVGTRAVELPVQQRINLESIFERGFPGLPMYLNASQIPATVAPGSAPTRANALALEDVRFPGFPADCSPYLADGVTPDPTCDPGFGGLLTAFPPLGTSIYHGASVEYTHRTGHGLFLRANYTFSKTIDNGSNELFSSRVNPRRSQDPNNFHAERGLSAMDFPQKFTIAWIYDIPVFQSAPGFLKTVLGGWQYNASYIAESGQPITALAGTDVNGDFDSAGDRAYFNSAGTPNTGTGSYRVCNDGPGGATRVASAGTPACPSGNTIGYTPIDPNAMFIQPGLGVFSNEGRNTVRSPGISNWNMSLFKNTKIGERFNLQFRAEAFDVFNHRNYSITAPSALGVNPSTLNNALSTSYPFVSNHQFLDAKQFNGGSRVLDLALKLVF